MKSKGIAMKTKFLFFIITVITSAYAYGQQYEIVNASPEFIYPGQINNVVVSLNQGLAQGDSILNSELQVYSKDYSNEKFILSSSITTIDTTVHITFDIPDEEFAPHSYLYLNMKRIDSYYGTDYYDSISYYGIKIGKEISFIKPEICIVQVDTSDKNVIFWENPSNKLIDSVFIYKETSVLNEFEKIATRAVEDIAMFKDDTSVPAQNSNRYTISFADTSGNESGMSYAHQTIHLSINVAVGGAINLAWNKYEGFYYSTFNIYRGFSKDNLVKIADIASNLYTLSDIAPPLGELYYQVQVSKSTPCVIEGLDPGTKTINSSKSNFRVYNNLTGINDHKPESNFSLYPNPVKDKLYINFNNEAFAYRISIYDMTGRLVHGSVEMSGNLVLNISDLQSGIYFVRMRSSDKQLSKTIIKL